LSKFRILAFGAHPDDIEIGCGGTIAKCSSQGHDVLCVVCLTPTNFEIRQQEARNACKVLNSDITFLNADPDDFQLNRSLIKDFDEIITDYKPDKIFTHWNHDSHQDHRIVSEATISSTRKNNCSLYMYEQTIPGSIVPYGFKPQLYIDITDTIELKIKSLLCHKSEADRHNMDSLWEYGIKGRASYRGYQINSKYAEAFEVVKELDII